MAEFTAIAVQTVATNGNVIFTDTTSACTKGIISRRPGSGQVRVKGTSNGCRAKYRVTFSGNIAVPTTGTAGAISLAIAIDGEADLSTVAIATPTATGAYNNVAMATDLWIPCGCCEQVSIKNTSTQPINVVNANITIDRVG